MYMILITDKDYFGEDYMMYTFKNRCVEVPGLEYDDGLVFLYFYTKGTKGGSESIHNMLKYLQDSRQNSAVDEATRKLDEYVSNVRRDPEIRGNYMTFGDKIDYEKQISLKQGIEQGIEQGKRELIESMLNNGKSVEQIVEFCGCSSDLVKKILDEMQALV